MEYLALTIGLVLDGAWSSNLDTTVLEDVRGCELQALLRIVMSIEYTAVVSCMVAKALAASAGLCIDQDIINTLSTALILGEAANFRVGDTPMLRFAASLPVAGLLLLHSRARLCILLVLEATTLALIICSRWRLVKVKDPLGLIQELQVGGACGRRRRKSLDRPILLKVVLLN